MKTDPGSSRPERPVAGTSPRPQDTAAAPERPRVTRASALWVATGVALVLLVLLIVFMMQNTTKVAVHFVGLHGTIPLGIALLIAAVGGGVLVALVGAARVTQLRVGARRARREASGATTEPDRTRR